MTRDDLLDTLAQRIAAAPEDRPYRVAVNGPVAVGKSMFNGDLSDRVRAHGRTVLNASIDQFRLPGGGDLPEDIGERLYSHVLDFARFRDELLLPDRAGAIVLADGVLLFHPELDPHWDLRIYLHCSESCAIERAAKRNEKYPAFPDAEAARENYRKRFLPFLALYEDRVDPRARADIVVDYEDYESPRIVG